MEPACSKQDLLRQLEFLKAQNMKKEWIEQVQNKLDMLAKTGPKQPTWQLSHKIRTQMDHVVSTREKAREKQHNALTAANAAMIRATELVSNLKEVIAQEEKEYQVMVDKLEASLATCAEEKAETPAQNPQDSKQEWIKTEEAAELIRAIGVYQSYRARNTATRTTTTSTGGSKCGRQPTATTTQGSNIQVATQRRKRGEQGMDVRNKKKGRAKLRSLLSQVTLCVIGYVARVSSSTRATLFAQVRTGLPPQRLLRRCGRCRPKRKFLA
jgi:hypothetical protein